MVLPTSPGQPAQQGPADPNWPSPKSKAQGQALTHAFFGTTPPPPSSNSPSPASPNHFTLAAQSPSKGLRPSSPRFPPPLADPNPARGHRIAPGAEVSSTTKRRTGLIQPPPEETTPSPPSSSSTQPQDPPLAALKTQQQPATQPSLMSLRKQKEQQPRQQLGKRQNLSPSQPGLQIRPPSTQNWSTRDRKAPPPLTDLMVLPSTSIPSISFVREGQSQPGKADLGFHPIERADGVVVVHRRWTIWQGVPTMEALTP